MWAPVVFSIFHRKQLVYFSNFCRFFMWLGVGSCGLMWGSCRFLRFDVSFCGKFAPQKNGNRFGRQWALSDTFKKFPTEPISEPVQTLASRSTNGEHCCHWSLASRSSNNSHRKQRPLLDHPMALRLLGAKPHESVNICDFLTLVKNITHIQQALQRISQNYNFYINVTI